MNFKELIGKVFKFNPATYYAWKRQQRPIILLLDKYFTKEELDKYFTKDELEELDKYFTKDELEEFLSTTKIEKFEKMLLSDSKYTISLKEAFKLMIDGYILESYGGFTFHFNDGFFTTTDDVTPFHVINEKCTNMKFKIINK